MSCTLYSIMSETDISKLGSYDKERFLNSDIRLNSKRYTFEDILESNYMVSAILDLLIEFIVTKNKNILHTPIVLNFTPTKLDQNLVLKVAIPENYRDKYQVKFVGDMIYIYDRYENHTLTINPRTQSRTFR